MPEEPRIAIPAISCRPNADDARRWRVSLVIHNLGLAPLDLETAWIPHGRFRGDDRLPLSGSIAPDDSHELEFAVTAAEAPGTVVDNAFLILRVGEQGHPWRIFVRMRIEFDSLSAVPQPLVEAITTQSLE